jgi:DNA-binding XRE family transcriptional regulator
MAVSKANKWKAPIDRVHSTLADNVRAARNAAGLTQDELATFAGLERKSINRIENNRLSPTIDTLVRIAMVLKVPVADLIDG